MIAYLNGEFIPLEEAKIPVWDFGFTMGVTLTERLRTFDGKLFFLDDHLQRLKRGVELINLESVVDVASIGKLVQEVVEKNSEQLSAGEELGVGICITPGSQFFRAPDPEACSESPTILIDAKVLPTRDWAGLYQGGVSLTTVQTKELPNQCVPRELKCRSRMHYYLAECEAVKKRPGSRALLLNMNGYVAEATTESVVLIQDGTLKGPVSRDVLPSVSRKFVESVLAPAVGLKVEHANLSVDDFKNADEVLWLSTSPCILPVSQVDDVIIGSEDKRDYFEKLIEAWSEKTGVSLLAQAIGE